MEKNKEKDREGLIFFGINYNYDVPVVKMTKKKEFSEIQAKNELFKVELINDNLFSWQIEFNGEEEERRKR